MRINRLERHFNGLAAPDAHQNAWPVIAARAVGGASAMLLFAFSFNGLVEKKGQLRAKSKCFPYFKSLVCRLSYGFYYLLENWTFGNWHFVEIQ